MVPMGLMSCHVSKARFLQAVAYIVRPNAPTMDAIRALRMDTSLQQVYYQSKLQEEEVMPYPLPPGTVSMHVRSLSQALVATLTPSALARQLEGICSLSSVAVRMQMHTRICL